METERRGIVIVNILMNEDGSSFVIGGVICELRVLSENFFVLSGEEYLSEETGEFTKNNLFFSTSNGSVFNMSGSSLWGSEGYEMDMAIVNGWLEEQIMIGNYLL